MAVRTNAQNYLLWTGPVSEDFSYIQDLLGTRRTLRARFEGVPLFSFADVRVIFGIDSGGLETRQRWAEQRFQIWQDFAERRVTKTRTEGIGSEPTGSTVLGL